MGPAVSTVAGASVWSPGELRWGRETEGQVLSKGWREGAKSTSLCPLTNC